MRAPAGGLRGASQSGAWEAAAGRFLSFLSWSGAAVTAALQVSFSPQEGKQGGGSRGSSGGSSVKPGRERNCGVAVNISLWKNTKHIRVENILSVNFLILQELSFLAFCGVPVWHKFIIGWCWSGSWQRVSGWRDCGGGVLPQLPPARPRGRGQWGRGLVFSLQVRTVTADCLHYLHSNIYIFQNWREEAAGSA